MALALRLLACAVTVGGPTPPAEPPTPTPPEAPAPPRPPRAPGAASPPSADEDQPGAPPAAESTGGFGLDAPRCSPAAGCAASELQLAVGIGSANFGGFGLGVSLRAAYLEARRAAVSSKGAVKFASHFNGLGQGDPGGRSGQGELGIEGAWGAGLVDEGGLRGALAPVAVLNVLAFKAGSFDGSTLLAYLPNAELGLLGRGPGNTALQLGLHGGANLFYGNGALSRLGDVRGTLSTLGAAPYIAADLRFDLPLGGTAALRFFGQAALTPDSLGSAGTRQIWWGEAEALLRLRGVSTGPTFSFFSPDRHPGGSSYFGSLPESSFLWVLSI